MAPRTDILFSPEIDPMLMVLLDRRVVVIHACARCSALIRDDDIEHHVSWHASVDTAATIELSGGGRT